MPIIVPIPKQQRSAIQGDLRPVVGQKVVPEQGNGELAVARGLEQASGAANNVQTAIDKSNETLKRKKNTATLLNAETVMSDGVRGYMTGLEARRGKDAEGITKEAESWWEENLDKVAGSIDDQDVRMMFMERMQGKRDASLTSIASHEAHQYDVATSNAAAGKIESSIGFAAANAGNPQAVALSRVDIIETTYAQAKLLGWSDEQRGIEVQKGLTAMHKAVFENLAVESPDAAKSYFEQNKSEIYGGAQDDFQKIIKTTEYRTGAQQLVDSLMSQNMTYEERRAEVRKGEKGEQRDYAMSLLEQEERRDNAAKQANEQAVVDSAWKQFQRSGRSTDIDAVTWSKLPGTAQEQIHNAERATINDIQEQQRERDRLLKEAETKNENEVYLSLLEAASSSPGAFATLDIRSFIGRLSPAHVEKLTELKDKVQNGGNAEIRTISQQINDATIGMKDAEKVRFIDVSEERLTQQQKAKGSPLTPDERKKTIDALKSEITWKRGGSGLLDYFSPRKATAAEIVANPETLKNFIKEFDISDVPPADRAQIEQALKIARVPVSDPEIIRRYLKNHGIELP